MVPWPDPNLDTDAVLGLDAGSQPKQNFTSVRKKSGHEFRLKDPASQPNMYWGPALSFGRFKFHNRLKISSTPKDRIAPRVNQSHVMTGGSDAMFTPVSGRGETGLYLGTRLAFVHFNIARPSCERFILFLLLLHHAPDYRLRHLQFSDDSTNPCYLFSFCPCELVPHPGECLPHSLLTVARELPEPGMAERGDRAWSPRELPRQVHRLRHIFDFRTVLQVFKLPLKGGQLCRWCIAAKPAYHVIVDHGQIPLLVLTQNPFVRDEQDGVLPEGEHSGAGRIRGGCCVPLRRWGRNPEHKPVHFPHGGRLWRTIDRIRR